MYKIVIANQCACFKKSNLENNLTFESKDEALSKAIEMKNIMNNEFCKKHKFELQEMFNNYHLLARLLYGNNKNKQISTPSLIISRIISTFVILQSKKQFHTCGKSS